MVQRDPQAGPTGTAPVVAVLANAELGGAELYLERLATALGPAWMTHVVVLGDGPFVPRLQAAGLRVDVLPARRGNATTAVVALRQAVRASGARVVHANGLKAALLAGPAVFATSARVVWVRHDFNLPRLSAAASAICSSTVCVSAALRDALPAFARRRATVVHNGVPRAATLDPGARERLCRAAGVDPDDELVVVSGRIHPGKGQLDAVDVVRRLRPARPRLRLIMLGEPDTFSADYGTLVDRACAAPELAGAIVRLGFRDDAAALVAGADLVLMPSQRDPGSGWREGFGLVAAEAMAAGVPVVAYDEPALVEVLGPAGTVVHGEDRAALADATATLLADPGRRAELARTGRARSQAFSVEAMAEAMQRVYRAAGA